METIVKKQDMKNSEKPKLDSENRENSIDVEKIEPSEVWKPGLLTKAFILFELGIWFLIALYMIYAVFFWDFGETW